jgi:hypothetical protein
MGSFWDPDKNLFWIPDPGAKRAATFSTRTFVQFCQMRDCPVPEQVAGLSGTGTSVP